MHDLPENPRVLMSEIASMCSDAGLHQRALDILERLAVFSIHRANALVALAVAQWYAGQEAAARQTLRDALTEEPEHDLARVTLAIYLHRSRDPEAAVLLRAVLAQDRGSESRDAGALALAESVKAEILQTTALSERVPRVRYTRMDRDSDSVKT
jgi:thioredoxin-like negative regulator of GroEL